MVSANDFDIEGLIVSTGCWKKHPNNTAMLDRIVDAYGKALPNLQVHAKGYPSLEYLKSILSWVRTMRELGWQGTSPICSTSAPRILELHDDGSPNLHAYRRVIINVQ